MGRGNVKQGDRWERFARPEADDPFSATDGKVGVTRVTDAARPLGYSLNEIAPPRIADGGQRNR